MKKILIFAVIAVLIFSITACGAKNEAPEAETSEKEETGNIPEPEEEGPPVPTEDAVEYPIKDEVIIDNDLIRLTVSSLKINEFSEPEVNLLCENKSDKNLSVYVRNASVCGYAIPSAYWSEEINAGKKVNSVLIIDNEELELADIKDIEEMTLRVMAKEMADNYDDIMEETVSFYPTGLDAGSVVFKDREPVEGEQVLVDNEQFKYVIERVEYDPNNGYVVHLFIENKTPEYLWLSWEELSLNDFMVAAYWGAEVLPGLRLYTTSVIDIFDLQANNITELEKFEFVLNARNGTDYFDAPDCFEERFVYEVKA